MRELNLGVNFDPFFSLLLKIIVLTFPFLGSDTNDGGLQYYKVSYELKGGWHYPLTFKSAKKKCKKLIFLHFSPYFSASSPSIKVEAKGC